MITIAAYMNTAVVRYIAVVCQPAIPAVHRTPALLGISTDAATRIAVPFVSSIFNRHNTGNMHYSTGTIPAIFAIQ